MENKSLAALKDEVYGERGTALEVPLGIAATPEPWYLATSRLTLVI